MSLYDRLENSYHLSISSHDPIDFIHRQHSLLHMIACYLLERDKPVETQEKESDVRD